MNIDVVDVEKDGTWESNYRELLRMVAIERRWPASEVEELTHWPGLKTESWVALKGEKVVGGFSLAEGDFETFPTFLDLCSLPDSSLDAVRLSRSCDSIVSEVTISAIHRDFRGPESSSIFAAMYGTLYWHLLRRKIRYVYGLLDTGICALYKRKLGLDFQRISPVFMKWNEKVFAACLDVNSVEKTLRPEIWEIFLLQRGMLDMRSPELNQ